MREPPPDRSWLTVECICGCGGPPHRGPLRRWLDRWAELRTERHPTPQLTIPDRHGLPHTLHRPEPHLPDCSRPLERR